MLQTLLWSSMTCFLTFLKYPLAVLAQTPATYILMYGNAFSTTFTAVRCFQLRKKVLRLNATSYQSSDRTVQHLCLWLQNEREWQFCKEFAPHPGGTNDNDAHACEPNYITVQNKLSHKYCSWTQGAHTICLCLCSRHKQIVWAPCVVNKFTTPNLIFVTPSFNEWVVFRDYYVLLCSTCLYRSVRRHGHHCHSSPLAEVRIPHRAAARAHFLVINKGAEQFILSFDTR